MAIPYCLINSILIAKTILDDNKNIISSIQLDRQYLGKEEFDLNKKVQLHTAIKPLIPVVKKELRKATGLDVVNIKIYQVNTGEYEDGENRMAGIVMKESEEKYIILLNEGETYCTQRLSLCKELCQIYVGSLIKEEGTLLSPHNQVIEAARELILKFYSAHSPELFDSFESSETFAHSIALELMIPYTLRDEIKKELDNKVGMYEIAKRLSITQETLEGYINTYFNLITPIYDLF